MQVHTFAPGEALAPFVRAFEIIEAGETEEKLLVPETALILGFRYAGSSSLVEGAVRLAVPDHVVTGLRATARRMATAAGSGIVLAKVREGAAGAFFAPPLHQLFGATVPLEELVDPREVEATSVRIRAARNPQARVEALERFLLQRLAHSRWRADPAVDAALRAIHADPGALRVAPLAASLGLSVDGLEKRFRRSVGASPKQVATILRLRRAIGAHRQGMPLTRLALDAGYYDQAHFIRQVVAAVGAAPRAFLSASEFCL